MNEAKTSELVVYSARQGCDIKFDLSPANAPKELHESIGMSNGGQGAPGE